MPRSEREELEKRLECSERKRTVFHSVLARRNVEDDTFLWSMADLMTLILIFFVLFYARALDQEGAPQVHKAHGSHPALRVEQPSSWQGGSRPVWKGASVSSTEKKDGALKRLRQEILEELDDSEQRAFTAREDRERLVFVLGERITFEEGEADLLQGFLPTLKRVADFIADKREYLVMVSGHTDSKPIHTERFPSNWELSAARAASVARFLIARGVEPQRIHIVGFSEYRPIVRGDSRHANQANRRVEITLVKEGAQAPPSGPFPDLGLPEKHANIGHSAHHSKPQKSFLESLVSRKAPEANSEGKALRFPPSDGRLNSIEAQCLPFSGGASTPALRSRGHPPWNPQLICLPVARHGPCDKISEPFGILEVPVLGGSLPRRD